MAMPQTPGDKAKGTFSRKKCGQESTDTGKRRFFAAVSEKSAFTRVYPCPIMLFPFCSSESVDNVYPEES